MAAPVQPGPHLGHDFSDGPGPAGSHRPRRGPPAGPGQPADRRTTHGSTPPRARTSGQRAHRPATSQTVPGGPGRACAMYTISALWTHVREGLDITTVISPTTRTRSSAWESQRLGTPADGPAHRNPLGLPRPRLRRPRPRQGRTGVACRHRRGSHGPVARGLHRAGTTSHRGGCAGAVLSAPRPSVTGRSAKGSSDAGPVQATRDRAAVAALLTCCRCPRWCP